MPSRPHRMLPSGAAGRGAGTDGAQLVRRAGGGRELPDEWDVVPTGTVLAGGRTVRGRSGGVVDAARTGATPAGGIVDGRVEGPALRPRSDGQAESAGAGGLDERRSGEAVAATAGGIELRRAGTVDGTGVAIDDKARGSRGGGA